MVAAPSTSPRGDQSDAGLKPLGGHGKKGEDGKGAKLALASKNIKTLNGSGKRGEKVGGKREKLPHGLPVTCLIKDEIERKKKPSGNRDRQSGTELSYAGGNQKGEPGGQDNRQSARGSDVGRKGGAGFKERGSKK